MTILSPQERERRDADTWGPLHLQHPDDIHEFAVRGGPVHVIQENPLMETLSENELATLRDQPHPSRVDLGLLQADNPSDVVRIGAEIAKPLAAVIKDRELFTTFGDRDHVHVDGWLTLAAMLGITPREISNTADEDGGYTAIVAMCAVSDGREITRASAECGVDEPNWQRKPRYARRSMAATRATSKACRMAFSWIMILAGYAPTPAEEMDCVPQKKPHRKVAERAGNGVTPVCPRCGDRDLFKYNTGDNWFCKESGGGCGDSFTPEELEVKV
jgi:hypothetical protein